MHRRTPNGTRYTIIYGITCWLSMISAAQIRAARALLGISAAELAEQADVDWSTVQRFESAEGVPPSRSGTLQRIKKTLENAGVAFLGDPVASPGVQVQRKPHAKRKGT